MNRRLLALTVALLFVALMTLFAAPLFVRAENPPATPRAPAAADDADKPIRALLVLGGCCHDYTAQKKIISEGVSARANVEWTIAHDPNTGVSHKNPVYDNPDWAKGFDVVVHDECCSDVKDLAVIDRVLKPHKEGLPAVVIHCGMHSFRSEGWPKSTPWFDFTGLATTHHRAQLPIAVSFIDKESPITKGLDDWTTINEELYNNELGKLQDTAHALARGKQGNDDDIVVWTNLYNGKTRVFGTTLGHNNATCADARYLDLLTRGLLWSCDKLDEKHLKPGKHVLAPVPGAPAGAKQLENLAQGKTVTASSTQGGNDPANAVDGDESTRWCASDGAVPQWLQVDLGKLQDVSGCKIAWEHEAVYWYKIETSADGSAWTQAIDATHGDSTDAIRTHKFDAKGVRFLKVTINGTGPGSWASINELYVLGTKMVEGHAQVPPKSDADARLLREVKVPREFETTIFAAPPDISYPTCLAAAPNGELFVGIDENGSLDQKPDRGRVVKCVDTTGSGHADKFTVFAKMDSPRGLAYDGETLYVLHPPFVTAYHDGGNGVADHEETLVSGLAHDLKWRGADHTTNGLRMGIDGWLYIAAGDYGAPMAVGKDGTRLQFHGGGVLRVRPDGSHLEVVSRGERNIYDVAIDPQMNLFTCDNTNDGDGWNVRLAHVFSSANLGYPTLFVHFPEEIVQPLNDYGGGSPTGSLYVSEPSFPARYGDALFTCEWGLSSIFRHPLERAGASYKIPTPREAFIQIPRPTGIAVDGQSHLYAASWRGAVFTYAGPKAGFIARVTPKGVTSTPFPDVKKLGEPLLGLLRLPSHVWRMQVQREILRRGDRPAFVSGLEQLTTAVDQPVEVRVAALYTLKQLRGEKSNSVILALAKDDAMREFAVRALTDNVSEMASVPSTVFTSAIGDANPRVRLQGVIGVGRLGRVELADAIVPLLSDGDPVISHAAVQALMALRATDACFKAIDSGSASVAFGAARVLQSFHDAVVVDGLIARLGTAKDAIARHAILTALCRLHDREADWDGDWWGTRPDTRGPYFRPVKWDQTGKIDQALRTTMATGGDDARYLIGEVRRHRINMAEATALMLKLAQDDPNFRAQAVSMIADSQDVPDDALPLLEHFASSAEEKPGLRARALRAMQHAAGSQAPFDATVRTLLAIDREARPPVEVSSARADALHDAENAHRVERFAKLSESADPAARGLAYDVLLTVSESHQAAKDSRAAAAKAIEKAWQTPTASASLLRAIGQTKFPQYALQVRSRLKDGDAGVRAAAEYAAGQLHLDQGGTSSEPLIATLKYEDVVSAVVKTTGDRALGMQLFQRQGCVACHTTSQSQPPKGPFLGDITARYSRPEILESILKPNAKIAQGFATQFFKLKDGNVIQGFIVREGGDDVEVRDVTGVSTTIQKKDIVKRGTLPTSIMAEGLAANLTIHDLASIVAYLDSLKGQK